MKRANEGTLAILGGWRNLLMPGTMAVVFALLTWPIWRWLWGEWMANDYYSHGVLILPVALYLIWRRLYNASSAERELLQGDTRGLLLLGIALGLYLFFYNNKAYYLAAFAMLAMIIGLVWTLNGLWWLRMLSFPIGYLTLMVPLPFVERATLPLALFTGVCSTALVRFFGLELTVIGNAVKLPNADLLIGAQCSGINSMIALIALTALCAYVLEGPWWGRLMLVVLAVPIAMLGNILRVSNLLVVARYWGADAAFRFYHDYSGIVFFAVVLLLLIPLTRILQCRTLRLDVL
ncbi:MAG TPA: exosortase/archaeosortase family protein [Caldilineaceae bacterium]|nr:exosortase/archaeosortase family protein [Caldilineaceae bacterium]